MAGQNKMRSRRGIGELGIVRAVLAGASPRGSPAASPTPRVDTRPRTMSAPVSRSGIGRRLAPSRTNMSKMPATTGAVVGSGTSLCARCPAAALPGFACGPTYASWYSWADARRGTGRFVAPGRTSTPLLAVGCRSAPPCSSHRTRSSPCRGLRSRGRPHHPLQELRVQPVMGQDWKVSPNWLP